MQLARIVLPEPGRPERLPLYADVAAGSLQWRGRGTAALTGTVSFAAYFNALPALHWARDTVVDVVELRLLTRGRGSVRVMGSDSAGRVTEIDRRELSGESATAVSLDLARFARGGWLWFELTSSEELTLEEGGWFTEAEPLRAARTSLAITTMDKPDFCIRTLAALGGAPLVIDAVDEIVIVDQGSSRLRDHAGFAVAEARLEGLLRVVEQANLGGSGGFSRGMLEVLDADLSPSVVLMDDDIELEPESILRAATFAAYTREPVVVGGHMFDLNRPTRLQALAEKVAPRSFRHGPIGPAAHDLAVDGLASSPWMHAPIRPDYTAWWFCLVPIAIVRELGLALPLFVLGDDIEFGLRAGAHGYHTVTLPGAAVWHVSWLDKEQEHDWRVFFHARNPLIAALVDGRGRGRLRPLVSAAYAFRDLARGDLASAQLRHDAHRAVLDGPGLLHAGLGTILGEVRLRRAEAEGLRDLRARLRLLGQVAGDAALLTALWGRLRRHYAAAAGRLASSSSWRTHWVGTGEH